MKSKILVVFAGMILIAGTCFGQDISQKEVPSLALNNFQKTFPQTRDVEWKMQDSLYHVEFETGKATDHEAWYYESGELAKHEVEIPKHALPEKVLSEVNSGFNGYKIDDVKKVTSGDQITYSVELQKKTEEWEITFDQEGKILSRIAD